MYHVRAYCVSHWFLPRYGVILSWLATNVCFINLHNSLKGVLILLLAHGTANCAEHFPSRYIGLHSQLSLQLAGGYSLACYTDEVNCEQPHTEVEMGILEDCTRKSRELAFAVIAIEFAVVVILMIYTIVEAPAFRTVIAVLIFGFNCK